MKLLRHGYLLLLPLLPLLQGRVEAHLGRFRPQQEALYLWSGQHVRRLTPGLESLAADIYWLRTVQYFGGARAFARDKRFDLLYPLIDITVTLDPRMEIAYRYGATFLSEPSPMGAGRPEQAAKLLERGIEALPRSWQLRQQLGLLYFFFLNDSERASEILLQAERVPGAPYWLETLSADILAKGGRRETARRMWQRMYEQSEEGVIRNNALVHLRVLDAQEAAERATAATAEFRQRVGRPPASLQELRASGIWRGSLVDPTDVPFEYDPASGAVSVSRQSTLWRPEG